MRRAHLGVPRRATTPDGLPQFEIHASDLILIQRELHLAAARSSGVTKSALLHLTARIARVRGQDVRLSPDQLRLMLQAVGARTTRRADHAHDRDRRLAVLRELMPLLPSDEQEAIRVEVRALNRRRQARRAARLG